MIALCYDTDPEVDFNPTNSIQTRKRDFKEIPEWLLPFGIATDSCQICISLRSSDYGKIFFFSTSYYYEMDDEEREENPLAPVFFAGPSLQEFLNGLNLFGDN